MKAKPLAGIRVLEIGAYISAPYASALLASLGAEVVKVEPPDGDPFRRGEDNTNLYFVQYNSGKKSVAVNLKSQSGVNIVKALLPKFDVFIENMRPGKIASLGLGEKVCRGINPGLVYASISGFGSGGPWVDRPAYDTIGQSVGGFYSLMNDADEPRLTGTPIADLITGVNAAMGILAALVGRERDQERRGALVETSLMEALSTLTIDALTQAFESGREPVRDSRHPYAQNFCVRTADGSGITLHLSSSQKFWTALARVIGREDLVGEPRFRTYDDRRAPGHYAELTTIMAEAFAKRSRAEWEARLLDADVPFAPVLTMREMVLHEQTRWLELLGPEVKGLPLVRAPWRFDGARPERSADAPHVGEHSREVLGQICSDGDLEALESSRDVKSVESRIG